VVTQGNMEKVQWCRSPPRMGCWSVTGASAVGSRSYRNGLVVELSYDLPLLVVGHILAGAGYSKYTHYNVMRDRVTKFSFVRIAYR